MKITEIEIFSGDIDRKYKVVCPISATVRAGSLFVNAPTLADINCKLQEEAVRVGANSVIRVQYARGVSLISYKELRATGLAVVVEPDEKKCPSCAETVKRAAQVCRFCGHKFEFEPVDDRVGVGIIIERPDNKIIISPVERGSAQSAGIRAGDMLLAIDGKLTDDMTVEDVVECAKGPTGSQVHLAIYREGVLNPVVFTVERAIQPEPEREIVLPPPVESGVSPGMIALIVLAAIIALVLIMQAC